MNTPEAAPTPGEGAPRAAYGCICSSVPTVIDAPVPCNFRASTSPSRKSSEMRRSACSARRAFAISWNHATTGAPERGPLRACAASCHQRGVLGCPHIADIYSVIADAGDPGETPPAQATKARSIKTPVQQQALEDAYKRAHFPRRYTQQNFCRRVARPAKWQACLCWHACCAGCPYRCAVRAVVQFPPAEARQALADRIGLLESQVSVRTLRISMSALEHALDWRANLNY